MRRRPLLPAVAAFLALVGCGSLDDAAVTTVDDGAAVAVTAAAPPPPPATAPPVEAPTLGSLLTRAAALQSSGRFEAALTVDGVPELAGGLRVTLSGESSGPEGPGRVTLDLSGLAPALQTASDGEQPPPPALLDALRSPIDMITVGERTWISGAGIGGLLGFGDGWLEVSPQSLSALGPALGGMTPPIDPGSAGGSGTAPTSPTPVDPTELLGQLGPIDTATEDLGPDTVRGVPTTRYRSEIDLAELLGGFFGFGEAAGMAVDPAEPMLLEVELWVDDAGALRRAELRADVEEAGQAPIALVFSLELFDLGAPIVVTPPDADDVTTLDQLDLEALATAFG